MSAWLPAEFEPGLVSVIIPTYNRAALLTETLASVFNQSHDRAEVLVVDDGSEDDTAGVAQEWRRRFEKERSWRFEYLRQPHLGGQAARNRGTRESRGEFINYLDDDDLLAADKIRLQLAAARSAGADLVYGPYAYFVHDRQGYGLRPPQATRRLPAGKSVFETWLRGWNWCCMAGLVSHGFVNRAGPWNEEIRVCQDLEFSARCFSLEPRLAHCAESMLYRRHHPGSVSNKNFAEYEESLIAFARAVEELALEALPGQNGRAALAQYMGHHAIRFYAKGSKRGADFCAAKVAEYDPDYGPGRSGLSTHLAYALGGFRLWAWKDRMRDRLKYIGRRLRGRTGGFRLVDALDLGTGRETAKRG